MNQNALIDHQKAPIYVSKDTHNRLKAVTQKRGLKLWVVADRAILTAVEKLEQQPVGAEPAGR